MPCYFFISDWAPELSPLMVSAINVSMKPLRGSSRGSAPASLFWTLSAQLVRAVLFRGRYRSWGASLSIQCRMKPS